MRSKVLEKTEGKAHPLVQAVAEEVHCMDLKIQVALQRSGWKHLLSTVLAMCPGVSFPVSSLMRMLLVIKE